MRSVDLTRFDGIDVITALAVVAEIGVNMKQCAGVKHFTCWPGLCPGPRSPAARR